MRWFKLYAVETLDDEGGGPTAAVADCRETEFAGLKAVEEGGEDAGA